MTDLSTSHPVTKRTFATFNLGFHCQDLKIAGSEKVTVKRMVKAHAQKWGANSAECMALHEVDVLGTQEMLKSKEFLKKLRESGLDYECHTSTAAKPAVAIFYRSSTMGHVDPLPGVHGKSHGVRDVAAIYVPHFELVFVNAWLDHKHKNKVHVLESIDPSLKAALGKRKVSQVILVGDMNDYKGHGLHHKTVKLAGLKTHLSGKLVHTCSEASHFHGVGDMIFDSAKGTTPMYGIPTLPHNWTPYTQLMSDHLPVLAVKEFSCAPPHLSPNKRKVDAEDTRKNKSPSLEPEDVALWDDVDPHESAPDVGQEWSPLCGKRARRE